jgi:hypothetical protein
MKKDTQEKDAHSLWSDFLGLTCRKKKLKMRKKNDIEKE